MDLFFLSVLIIFLGGILPLFVRRQFAVIKFLGVFGMGAVCLLGLIDSGLKLAQPAKFCWKIIYPAQNNT